LSSIARTPIQRRLRQQRIYLSYSYDNSVYAEQLGQDLQADGFNVWLASRDIYGGDSWIEVMYDALWSSTHLFICLSPSILGSVWIPREVLIAEEILGIPIIVMVVPNAMAGTQSYIQSYLSQELKQHPELDILNDKYWFFPEPDYPAQLSGVIEELNAAYDQHTRTKIFISYRRADTQLMTERLYDNLKGIFKEQDIFLDTEAIPIGQPFQKYIDRTLTETAVLLVMIGSDWATIRKDGEQHPRLENLDDAVRIEVSTALKDRHIKVIPVLVDGAPMPA